MTDFNPNIYNGDSTQKEYTNPEATSSFSIEDLIKTIFRNWYWFAISIFFCLCLGVYYIKTTPKIYKREATILVKDSRKGGSSDILAFQDILGQGRRNVDNELFILLQSPYKSAFCSLSDSASSLFLYSGSLSVKK